MLFLAELKPGLWVVFFALSKGFTDIKICISLFCLLYLKNNRINKDETNQEEIGTKKEISKSTNRFVHSCLGLQ